MVSVPVLSKTITAALASVSRNAPPLINTPLRAAPATADRYATGVEMINAHGLATINTMIARYTDSRTPSSVSSVRPSPRPTEPSTTATE